MFSAINLLKSLAAIFLVLFAPEPGWCFPLTAGGNASRQVFFCKDPGCAANVTNVFCNDEPLSINTPVRDCTGLPPTNKVCQHRGRVFVAIDTSGNCDFEGVSYINTEKCTDHTRVCNFTSATTPSPFPTEGTQVAQTGLTLYSVGVIVLILVVVLGLMILALRHFCKKRQNRGEYQHPANTILLHNGEPSRLENGHLPHDPGA